MEYNLLLSGDSYVTMVTVLIVFMYVNHLHMVLLSRSRDFYHTCYCLSGLSVCQHHPTGDNDMNSDDEDSVILVNALSVNKLCDCGYHIVSPCTLCSMYICHCHYCHCDHCIVSLCVS